MSNENITEENRGKIDMILLDINHKTLDHLSKKDYDLKGLDEITHQVFQFVSEENHLIPTKIRDRVYKFMKNMHESIENLQAIHYHRTPISLKAYCEVFIYIFPFIYAPTIIYNIGLTGADWIAYFVVLLTQFILISLYNIQNHLEYPFDNVGMDDIHLANFKMVR